MDCCVVSHNPHKCHRKSTNSIASLQHVQLSRQILPRDIFFYLQLGRYVTRETNKQTENSWFADQRLWRQCQWREQMETFLQIALGPRVACESRNSLSRIVQNSRGPWVAFTTRHQIELPVTVDKMMHASVYFISWLPYTLFKNAATGLPRAANKHVSPRTMCET